MDMAAQRVHRGCRAMSISLSTNTLVSSYEKTEYIRIDGEHGVTRRLAVVNLYINRIERAAGAAQLTQVAPQIV